MQNSKIFPGTIPRNPRLWGEESLFSFSDNVQNLSYCNSNAEFKNYSGDKTPDLCFREEESLFSFSENVLKLSLSNAGFKNSPGDNTPDLRFRERTVFFVLQKCTKTLLRNAEFPKNSGGRTPDPVFGKRRWKLPPLEIMSGYAPGLWCMYRTVMRKYKA